MSQPLVSTARIDLSYSVSSLLHHLRCYIKNLTVSGASWDIDANPAVGGVLDWALAAQGLWDTLRPLMPTSATVNQASLQSRSGLIWTPLASYSPTGAVSANAYSPAQQATLTLRDTSNFKVRVIVLEQTFPIPAHFPSYGALTGDTLTFAKQFTVQRTVTNAPWEWLVSRGERFLSDFSFVALTTDLNDDVRRARGLV